MGGERAKPDAVRWNAEHDARMASMRVVWLAACPASCAWTWFARSVGVGEEAKSGQKRAQGRDKITWVQ